MGLELYAKVEHLLGIDQATVELHHYFFDLIDDQKPQTLLDVGCGKGTFLKKCKKEGINAVGIDLSLHMIELSKEAGLSVSCQDISQTAGAYDAITAIFDVVNFLNVAELKSFFGEVSRLLKPEGKFYADINTLYGFEEVADGVLVHNDDKQTLTVEATFLEGRLTTDFTYFSLEDDCFKKETDQITQYFYTIEDILKLTNLELQIEVPIELYGDEPDKAILVFSKK